ncbi:MAG TPA: hypothetical protein VJO35_13620 [Terriglobales bacterium]|nr:hypothetical protein [Terriglobales bacterium]
MYTGTLIDDLIGMVERAENSNRMELEQKADSENWFAILPGELLALEAAPQLAGVA